MTKQTVPLSEADNAESTGAQTAAAAEAVSVPAGKSGPLGGRFKKRWRLWLAALGLGLVGAGGLRLAAGPVDADALRFLIVERLERELPGSRARIDHMQIVWFHDSNAIGLKLDGLAIVDARGRPLANAENLEAALAIDSLLVWHLAPARLKADHFFVAVSVSEAGRYELGYEARGKPEALGRIDQAFLDLVGREKLGSPVSFTRHVNLTDGVVALSQTGSNLNWRADIDRFDFTKRNGRIRANLGLEIHSRAGVSKLHTISDAEIGLKTATLSARIENLTPSDVFPSVGVTRPLANFHAPVNGRGNLSYTAANGFEGAFFDISAGRGHYDFGNSKQDFESMRVVTTYEAKTRTFNFDRFELAAHLIETDLRGKVRLVPEDKAKREPMRVDFDFSGPRVTGKLADDFRAQTMRDVHFIGAFTPDKRSLKIIKGRGLMDRSEVETQGLVYTDAKGQLGADLTASIKGDFSKEQVFVFWPENLSGVTRDNLIERIKGGTYSNARFTLKAPPGHINGENLKNEDLRLDFDFRDMGLSIDPRMTDAHGLTGHGTLLGDSFSMTLASGRLVNVDLTDGELSVPSFHKASGLDRVHIWIKAKGQGADIIEAIDPVTGNELAVHGLNHERLSGNADVRLDIRFPTFEHITERNLDIRFEARMKDAGLKRAALGWDLTHGDLVIKGDMLANRLGVEGVADLGPYRGKIAYASAFVPKEMKIDFDGDFDAKPFGGSPKLRVPIRGDFVVEGPNGHGRITSDIYNGGVVWTGRDDPNETGETRGEPTQVDLDGYILTRGLVAQGLPIFSRLKTEVPAKLSLVRSGNIWSGAMSAEVLSGDIAYIQGTGSRLVYKAAITPSKAHAFGFGGLPLFRSTRYLTLNIGLESDTREALISFDRMRGILGWTEAPGNAQPLRTYTMTLKPEDLSLVGLPSDYFRPATPIELSASWQQDDVATRGSLTLSYPGGVTPLSFVMPAEPLTAMPGDTPFALRVTGPIDTRLLEVLSYNQAPLRVQGRVAAAFTLSENPQGYTGVVNFDARNAELSFAGSKWVKPLGEPTQFGLGFDEGDQGQGMNLTRLYADGPSTHIEGRAELDANGNAEFADFSKIYLKDFMDGTARFYQNAPAKTRLISINGRLLDIKPFLDGPEPGPDPVAAPAAAKPGSPPVPDAYVTRIVIDLERLRSATEAFNDVKIDATFDPARGATGTGRFLSQNGSVNSLVIEPAGDATNPVSHFRLTSTDMGNFLRTAFDVHQVHEGTGDITGFYTPGQTDLVLKARNIKARQIPVMAQLLSVASLKGMADTMSGEGITFSEVNVPVRVRDGLIYIDNGWAKGEALGFSVRGTSARDGQLHLNGALIPAYSLNSLFGDVHDRGEGLVGIRYAIDGTVKAPQVMVEPLSLMMPGFMRRWFDKTPEAAIAPLEVPDKNRKEPRAEASPPASGQADAGGQ